MSSPYDDLFGNQTPLHRNLIKTICVSDVLQIVNHSGANNKNSHTSQHTLLCYYCEDNKTSLSYLYPHFEMTVLLE